MCFHYAKNSNVLLNNLKLLKISVTNAIKHHFAPN